MLKHLIVSFALLGAGCNLFSGTTAVGSDASDASDASESVSTDAGTDGDLGEDVDPASDLGVDTGRDADLGCVAESDEDLCRLLDAECGRPLRALDVVNYAFEAEDVIEGGCDSSDGFAQLCNPSALVVGTFQIETAGDYLLETSLRADLYGEPAAQAELSVNGEVFSVFPIYTVAPDIEVIRVVIPLVPGDQTVVWRFVNDAYLAASGNTGAQDRNLMIDSFSVNGPIAPVVDRCGNERSPDCGTCGDNEACGLLAVNRCACACPLDAACAPAGPHPTSACIACTPGGWDVARGNSCDDGDACTVNDRCDTTVGVCIADPMSCVGDACEVGTCSAGVCNFSAAAEGASCGDTGVCQSGVCGCVGGPTVETNCTDNNDNDCDGLTNCADPDCDGLNCGSGKSCLAGACQ